MATTTVEPSNTGLKGYKVRDCQAMLSQNGFTRTRVKGSHYHYHNAAGRRVTLVGKDRNSALSAPQMARFLEEAGWATVPCGRTAPMPEEPMPTPEPDPSPPPEPPPPAEPSHLLDFHAATDDEKLEACVWAGEHGEAAACLRYGLTPSQLGTWAQAMTPAAPAPTAPAPRPAVRAGRTLVMDAARKPGRPTPPPAPAPDHAAAAALVARLAQGLLEGRSHTEMMRTCEADGALVSDVKWGRHALLTDADREALTRFFARANKCGRRPAEARTAVDEVARRMLIGAGNPELTADTGMGAAVLGTIRRGEHPLLCDGRARQMRRHFRGAPEIVQVMVPGVFSVVPDAAPPRKTATLPMLRAVSVNTAAQQLAQGEAPGIVQRRWDLTDGELAAVRRGSHPLLIGVARKALDMHHGRRAVSAVVPGLPGAFVPDAAPPPPGIALAPGHPALASPPVTKESPMPRVPDAPPTDKEVARLSARLGKAKRRVRELTELALRLSAENERLRAAAQDAVDEDDDDDF